MQRRLTFTLIGVSLASVFLVGVGMLILAQIGARDQAAQEATEQLEVLAEMAALPQRTEEPGQGEGQEEGQGRGRGARERTRIINRTILAFGLQSGSFAVVDASGVAWSVSTTELGNGPVVIDDGDRLAELSDAEIEQFGDGEVVVLDRGGRSITVIRAVTQPAWIVGADSSTEVTLALTASKEVVTIAREARLWFLVSALAVLAGSLLASWLLARRFTKPIRQIQTATAAIAGGDFAVRLDPDGDDELRDLGRSVNDMAADLERSKALDQQFLMSVSHDLRTPLTAISGYAEALRDGAVTDVAHTGDIIGSHANRLERLVGDLLDLAKLDANRFQLDLQPLDAGVVVGRAVAGMIPQVEQHGLTLDFEKGEPAPVQADADRLAQLVGNLTDNAVKFARSRVVVTVSVEDQDVLIAVVDDGPGIAKADLPFVFDRLYVASSQPVRGENPSGMGLAIVRELATAMGGSVGAEASAETGTTMLVRLPLLQP